jgi:glycosyltransferase involved in cell wall biosynthesis
VIRVLADDRQARRLGLNGLERVTTRFSIESMVRAYETIYEAMLGGAPLPAPAPVTARVA